jgi:HSP20 family protein
MSNLIRWEPMRDMMTLREAMDHLFDEAFTRPFSMSGSLGMPTVDIYQTDEEVVIRAALPGIKAGDVQISVTGDVVTIKGEMKEKTDSKEKSYHIREQRYGSFERILSLPTAVVSDKAKAEFEDGVLIISLPKAEEVKPKTITVKAK